MDTFLKIYKASEVQKNWTIDKNAIILSDRDCEVFSKDIKENDKDALMISVIEYEKIIVSYKNIFKYEIDNSIFIKIGQGHGFSDLMLQYLFEHITSNDDRAKDEIDFTECGTCFTELYFVCFDSFFYDVVSLEGLNNMLDTNFINYQELNDAVEEGEIDYLDCIIACNEPTDEILCRDMD